MSGLYDFMPWLVQPFDVLRNSPSALALIAGGFAFGAIHALLPGHGKLMLSGRHALAVGSARSLLLPLVDGMTLAATRVFLAFALVAGSVALAGALGFVLPLWMLQTVAGCALIAIALHLVWPKTRSHGALHLPESSRRPLDASLLVLALAPEPVALAITSFGVAEQNLRAASLVLVGLALGVGLTLGLAATFARAARDTNRIERIVPYAGFALALALLFTGSLTLYEAWQGAG